MYPIIASLKRGKHSRKEEQLWPSLIFSERPNDIPKVDALMVDGKWILIKQLFGLQLYRRLRTFHW